jgi:1,5-anhydro-D-fructose reductase (1,5-anhydro-D-mannitol-forming)
VFAGTVEGGTTGTTAAVEAAPPAPPRPLRVAVLSFWHVHARDYAARAQEHPGADLVAVWDDEPERGREGAERFGVPFEPDLDALLARDDVDGVIVTTATRDHRPIMERVAAAGKHIFTEKVLAAALTDAEAVLAACDRAGIALTVSLPRLYHGYTAAIRDLLSAGALGRVSYARVRLSHDGASAGWLPDRFFEPEEAIGGALTDLGCHPVYLVQLILGARPDTVAATYRSLTGRPVEDHAVVTVGYPDQAVGVIEAGFISANPFTIEVLGTQGSLYYSSEGGLRLLRDKAWETLPVPEDRPDAFDQWVGHIRSGTRADDNVARALDLTRLVAAANESAAGRRIIVDR